MLDAIKWRDLDNVNLLVCVLGSIILATLTRASCMAIIIASEVSGIVLVFKPGGALSSLLSHSVIGTI